MPPNCIYLGFVKLPRQIVPPPIIIVRVIFKEDYTVVIYASRAKVTPESGKKLMECRLPNGGSWSQTTKVKGRASLIYTAF